MKKKLLLLLIIPLFIVCCSFFSSKRQPTTKPEILVTIAPYKYFVERLTDNSISVKNLVPEAADPHGFEPPAKELVGLFDTKVWFLIGEPFEKQFLPIIQKNDPDINVVHLDEDVAVPLHLSCSHHSHHSLEDRHFWMSPNVMKTQINIMAKTLQKLYPEKSALIEQRLGEVNLDFDNLDLAMSESIKKYDSDYLLISHPAFGYFCRDYGLHQLALENETQDPSPKELATLFSMINEKDIKNIYVQKQHNYKMAKLTADSLNLKMVEVNPYKENYFENMHSFGNQLEQQ